MLMRRLTISLLVIFSLFVLAVAANRQKPESKSEILSRLSDYKSWKQVNRIDGEPQARVFEIERSFVGGG